MISLGMACVDGDAVDEFKHEGLLHPAKSATEHAL